MKKLLISFFVLAVLLILSGCGQKPASQQPQQTSPTGPPQIEEKQPPKEDGLFSGSIKDLFGKKDNLKCEVTYGDEQGQGKSVTYVSGDKARVDVEMKEMEGTSFSSHTIVDGEWMYMWIDGQNKGTKMKLDAVEEEPVETTETPEATEPTGQTQTNINEEFDYKCSPWTPDTSLFVPPSNVEFTDLSETLQKMQQSACAMCDSIPDATAKAECQKSCP